MGAKENSSGKDLRNKSQEAIVYHKYNTAEAGDTAQGVL